MADTVPSSPGAWRKYANASWIQSLPYKSSQSMTPEAETRRDILIDIEDVVQSRSQFIDIYSDILALNHEQCDVVVKHGGSVQLTARVLTSASPSVIKVEFAGSTGAFILRATTFDQNISLAVGDSEIIPLAIGQGTPNAGVQVACSSGTTKITYSTNFEPLETAVADFQKLLQTQLRMATVLFWLNPEIATALASFIVRATINSRLAGPLNVQANSLAQQLMIVDVVGPHTFYAPVLSLETYRDTLDGAIDAADAFRTQYDRFVDKQASLDDQVKSLQVVLSHAADIQYLQKSLAIDARKKWEAAQSTLNSSIWGLRGDDSRLRQLQSDFTLGIKVWKKKMEFQAVVEIFTALASFAFAIGAICIGDPAPAAAGPAIAEKAIVDVAKAAKAAQSSFKVTADTLTKLKDVVEIAQKLWESTSAIVTKVQALTTDPNADLTSLSDDVSGDSSGIAEIAAWDQWLLDVDNQLNFAVDQGIDGASEYKLGLQKHGINGKLLTQARANAIRAGQEYSQAILTASVGQKDFARLQGLAEHFKQESSGFEEAKALFYDRQMAMTTNVLLELRKVTWAYRYLSLRSSLVQPDPLKSIQDLRADRQAIVQSVEVWEEKLGGAFQDFTLSSFASDEAFIYGEAILASLRSNRQATFTMPPPPSPTSSMTSPDLSSPFPLGSTHVRAYGMRVFLIGVQPTKSGQAVKLEISTSGLYSDVDPDSQDISTFSIQPWKRPFQYVPAVDPKHVDDAVVEIDTYAPSAIYADITPFTQWTIRVVDAKLDLSLLKDVKLVWKGKARFL